MTPEKTPQAHVASCQCNLLVMGLPFSPLDIGGNVDKDLKGRKALRFCAADGVA